MKGTGAVLALLVSVSGPPAGAAVIEVDTAADEVSVDGACSLREALLNAGDAAGGDQTGGDCTAGDGGGGNGGLVGLDEVRFAAALANGTITLDGAELPLITESVDLVGPVDGDPEGLTISGDQLSRILNVLGQSAGDLRVRIDSLTLTLGATSAIGEHGGCVRSENADLEVFDGEVSLCDVNGDAGSGGGVYVQDGDLYMQDSVVDGNAIDPQLPNSSGGGISVRFGDVELLRTTIRANATANSFPVNSFGIGGGMALVGGNLIVTDCVMEANNATAITGGIHVFNESMPDATVTISGSILREHTGQPGPGGFLHVVDSDVTIADSEFRENDTTTFEGHGGSIYVDGGDLSMTDSLVTESHTEANTAHGGGVAVFGGDVELVRTDLIDNHTLGDTARGGGVYVDFFGSLDAVDSVIEGNETFGSNSNSAGAQGGGPVSLVATTLLGNRTHGFSASGAALNAIGDLVMINSTVSGNHALDSSANDGAIVGFGNVTVLHSTLAGNTTAGSGADAIREFSGDTFTMHNSLVIQFGGRRDRVLAGDRRRREQPGDRRELRDRADQHPGHRPGAAGRQRRTHADARAGAGVGRHRRRPERRTVSGSAAGRRRRGRPDRRSAAAGPGRPV